MLDENAEARRVIGEGPLALAGVEIGIAAVLLFCGTGAGLWNSMVLYWLAACVICSVLSVCGLWAAVRQVMDNRAIPHRARWCAYVAIVLHCALIFPALLLVVLL